jgi:hypothetical protein
MQGDPPMHGSGGALNLWTLLGLGGAALTAAPRRHCLEKGRGRT